MLKILLSNDDGINSPGIYHLANCLKEIGIVTLVAPESEKSASGLSITMHKPLRIKKVDIFDDSIDAWCINGTPSDCIKFAIDSLLDETPDIVISGINQGSNLGTDVLYSGTVSAAIEGAINKVPSIAVSLDTVQKCNFEPYAKIAAKLCKKLYENKIEKGLVMNINMPYIPINEIKGVKVTKLGTRRYKNCFIERLDPRGKSYFWLAGELDEKDINNSNTDVGSINNNYISVTPISFDLTSYETISKMKKWKLDI